MKNNSSTNNSWPQRLNQVSVTTKFLVALGAVMVLIAIVQIVFSANSTSQQIKNEAQQKMAGYYQVYKSHISAETNAAAAMALSIAARSDIQEMYLNRDRDGLYELLHPMFEDMQKRQIQHLYIHNPDGTVFLRVHNRAQFGDDATYRLTLANTIQDQVENAGIEIGPNRLGIRGVAPMYSNGDFIGLVEIGIDFDEALVNDLKQFTGADYTMWISYGAAETAGLKPQEGVPASSLDEIFYYTSTTSDRQPISAETYRSVLETGESSFQIYTENTTLPSSVFITPLLGYQGKQLGILEISIPYAEVIQRQNNATTTIALATAGLTLLGLFLIAFFNNQVVIRPLQVLSSFARNQLEGDFTARIALKTGDEFEQLANSFNSLANTVQEDRLQMEQRVADRTKALATVAEISTSASTSLETDKLLQQVVDLAKERFELYHAHIYLLDETGTSLVLTSGAGEAGKQMVAKGHSIPLDQEQSLVARVAREGKGVTVNDVTTAPDFLPNPLLPNTRSELAVPMMAGKDVIGVFDVQSDIVGRFTESDIAIQITLASQIASAVQNARSYTELQRNQSQLSEALNISRLANWEYDVEKDLFTFNDQFYSIFRTSVEHVGSYKISSAEYARLFVHPEDAPLVGAEIQRVLESKERYFKTELEHRIIFSNGEVGYITVKVNAERDENGKIVRFYGANQDVTERRQLEEQNRKRANQQEMLSTITQRIQNAATIESALQVAARELGHALGNKPAMIQLNTKSGKQNLEGAQ